MSKHYFIKFEPLGEFFIGGEQTFGSGAQTNYLVKSNYFPQQTGILGLLRYELLLQNGLLSAGKSSKLSPNAANLIGAKSFHLNRNNSTIDFGAIKALSPLHIINENKDNVLPAPFDVCPTNKYQAYKIKQITDSKTNLKVNENLKAISLSFTNDKGETKSYSEKQGIQHQFINRDLALIQSEDIYIKKQKIGIHKAGEDESFYKQTKLQFKNGYAFAIYATLNVPADKTFESNTIFMGGDKSAFEMTVEEIPEFKTPNYNESVFENTGNIKKLILTSPAYVDKSIYDNCVFAITEQQAFRFLQTTVNYTDAYYNLSKDKSKKSTPYKSEQFNLLKAGSVFYYEDAQLPGLEAALNKYPQFKQIGYNYYQTK